MKAEVIYNMPEDEYHAIDAISGSRIKEFAKHPMSYWHKFKSGIKQDDEQTPQMLLGNLYHKFFIEGYDEFYKTYAVTPAKTETRNGLPVLDSANDIKEFLDKNKIEYLKSSSKAKLIELVPEGKAIVWQNFMHEWIERNKKRQFISSDFADQVQNAYNILSTVNSFKEMCTGGKPEVSIFWTDETSGLRCKARIDYLQKGIIDELKTFSNSQDKDIETAVIHEIIYRRYDISAVHYINGINQLRKEGHPDILELFPKEPIFRFIFIKTGKYPAYKVLSFTDKDNLSNKNHYYNKAKTDTEHYIKEIKRLEEKFRSKPWLEEEYLKVIDDTDIPMWFLQEG